MKYLDFMSPPRYTFKVEYYDFDMCEARPVEDGIGQWVRVQDYERLLQALDETECELELMRVVTP